MAAPTIKTLFPGGRYKALTASYDDGVLQDRRLVEIFNRYGIRSAFNINSGHLGKKDGLIIGGRAVDHSHLDAGEIKTLFRGHEVAVHSHTHPHLDQIPKEEAAREILEDRRILEEYAGYPVRGMAYPCGTYNGDVIQAAKSAGIEYARTIEDTRAFGLPRGLMTWAPTCHHNDPELFRLAQMFLDGAEEGEPALFYLWGHSFEFDLDGNWERIEDFCSLAGGSEKVWYATGIEIADYLNGAAQLRISAAGDSVCNPACQDIWVEVLRAPVRIGSGRTVALG